MTNKPEAGAGGFDPSAMQGADPAAMMQMFGAAGMVGLAIGLAIFAFMIFLNWRVFSKAGYPGALALLWLLLLIPIINLIGILVVLGVWIWFAFAEWPVQRQAKGQPAKA